MKEKRCKACNRRMIGTARRQFCSDNCRVSHWQKKKTEQQSKLRRFKLPKERRMSVDEAQYKVLAGLLVLEEAAKNRDEIALKVLREVDRLLNRIAKEV